jgi:hypothetical protein
MLGSESLDGTAEGFDLGRPCRAQNLKQRGLMGRCRWDEFRIEGFEIRRRIGPGDAYAHRSEYQEDLVYDFLE